MDRLTTPEITVMLLSLGMLLAAARFFGELARRFKQPAVAGELLAGILLGPTVFGALLPDWFAFLFPAGGGGALVLDAFTIFAVVLFLLVAGMEVDLLMLWRQGKAASMVALAGIAIPLTLGFVVAWFAPQTLGMDLGPTRSSLPSSSVPPLPSQPFPSSPRRSWISISTELIWE